MLATLSRQVAAAFAKAQATLNALHARIRLFRASLGVEGLRIGGFGQLFGCAGV